MEMTLYTGKVKNILKACFHLQIYCFSFCLLGVTLWAAGLANNLCVPYAGLSIFFFLFLSLSFNIFCIYSSEIMLIKKDNSES